MRNLSLWSELFLRPLRTTFSTSSPALSSGFGSMSTSRCSSPPASISDAAKHLRRAQSAQYTGSQSVTDLYHASQPLSSAAVDMPVRVRHRSEGDLMTSSYDNVSLGSSPSSSRPIPVPGSLRVAALVGNVAAPTALLREATPPLSSRQDVAHGRTDDHTVLSGDGASSNAMLSSDHEDVEGLLAAAVQEIEGGKTLRDYGEDSGCPSETSSPSPHRPSKDSASKPGISARCKSTNFH